MTTVGGGEREARSSAATARPDETFFEKDHADVRMSGVANQSRTAGHERWITVSDAADDLPARDSTPSPKASAELEHRLDQIALARRIATAAHVGQVDKLGVDYIEHPGRVAARLPEPDQQAVAWLHDVVEDTVVTEDDLRAAGIDEDVVAAVLLLSRNRGDAEHYYERIAASPLARAVKLADIADNTDPARTAQLDETTRTRLAERYRNARRALGAEEERP